ncbi:type II CAAX prenyl endopeptidase Rce1 family protein [Pseudomonadota bacterium]
MSTSQQTINFFGITISSYKLNIFFSICGVYLLGIFLTWYLTAIVRIPLPDDVPLKSLTTAVLQTVCTIIIPYIWAIKRLNFSLQDLGISTKNLIPSTILGCTLYTLALAAFLHCSSDPLISNHAIRQVDIGDASILLIAMSLIAAGTDLATRGFILFTLERYTNLPIAIFLQNVTWFAGHMSEINLLENCLGLWTAIGLTLTLGILGDVIALKTRNIIGLSIAHILLNVVLTFYIRSL